MKNSYQKTVERMEREKQMAVKRLDFLKNLYNEVQKVKQDKAVRFNKYE